MLQNTRKGLREDAEIGYAMSQDTTHKLRRIYDILITILLILSGIALAAACIQIYRSGDRPFSPASITQHFLPISWLIYGTGIAVVFGLVLDLILPRDDSRPKPVIFDDVRLERQLLKGEPTDNFAEKALKELKLRRRYVTVTAIVFALLMVYPAVYFTNIEHFTVAALNHDVILSLAIALIPGIIGLGLCLLCKYLCSKSYLRELAICKDAAKAGSVSRKAPDTKKKFPLNSLRLMIGVVAIWFIIIGIFNGGASDVLLKAIAICTECIGLG